MKKIFLFSALIAIAAASCKKASDPSQTVTVSYPTITVNGSLYYSIGVGGSLPTVSATAYDSFYHEMCTVIIDQSTLDNSTPGLYAVTLTASNKYGMVGSSSVYIGVTAASPLLDLTGTYIRTVSPANSNRVAHVSKLGTGLFQTDNAGGVDITDPSTGIIVPAVFVVTSDTTIDFGTQLTVAGTWSANSQMLSLAAGDTTLSYAVSNANFGTQVRTFVKQ